MKLRDWISFSGDFMGPGAAIVPAARNKAVGMQKTKVAADASPSDFANAHIWEPSATDTERLAWNAKRAAEKVRGRNLRVFEDGTHT